MAASQPPATAKTLDELPDDLLVSILVCVPCKDDRASMSLVCKGWRAMVDRLAGRAPPSPPLPWLLLPAPNPNGSARVVCLLTGCRVHQEHRFTAIIPPGARFVGSHDGAWLLLAFRDPHRHQLLNVRTGDVQDFPGKLVITDHPHHPYPAKMVIHAAALSSSPDGATYVAVCIVRAAVPPHYRYVAIWQKGWPWAMEMQPPDGLFFAEDVIYHEGGFHLLHANGDQKISVCIPEPSQDYHGWETRRFHPGRRIDDEFVRSRYLVSSRGELLLVVRFTPHPDEPTSKFKVFRATERPQMPDDAEFPVAEFPWAWSELDTLDGRILFVGYGCSRSYDADQYSDLKAGIYFFDDEQSDDEGVFFRDHNIRPYPCRDNGKYSEGRVQRCFPTTDPSDASPPAWLLPRRV